MDAQAFWREEGRRFFDRNYRGRDLRALPPTSYLVELLARAPYLDEHLLVADVDLREVDRLRWRLPILAAERSDIEGPTS